MKPIRFLTVAIILLGMVVTASAMTPANTVISNQAFGNYKDAAGTSLTQVASNLVTTTVSQVAGASFGTAQTATMSAMSSTVYAVQFQNTGNGADNFTFAATGAVTGTGTYSLELFHDLDGDGNLDQAEIDAAATWQDTTGLISMDEIYKVLIRVTDTKSGGSPAGDKYTVTLTSTSAFVESPEDQVVNSTILLTTTVAAAAINGETNIINTPTYAPNTSIVYESCFTNNGTEVGKNLVFVTEMPSNTTLDINSVSIDGGSNFVTVDNTSPYEGSYQYNPTTRILTVVLGDLAAAGQICVTYSAVVDANASAGDPIVFPANNPGLTYENPEGDTYPTITPDEIEFPVGGPDVAQFYAVDVTANATAPTDTSSMAGEPGTEIRFAFTVKNTGNGADSFTLSGLLENNAQDNDFFTSWIFYVDADGDGVLDAGETTTAIETASIASGNSLHYIAVATIPGGTADTFADGVTFSATTTNGAGESDGTTITVTCEAPVIISGTGGLFKSVSPTGNQPPTTVLTYTLTVLNSGSGTAHDVVITDPVPANTTLVVGTLANPTGGVVTHTTTGGTYGNGTVTFTFTSIAPNTSKSMSFQVTID